MQLIDTHVHINFDSFAADLESVARSWREAGVVQLVHSCVEPNEFSGIQAIADRFPEVRFAVGLHPLDMDKWSPGAGQQIKVMAQSDRRVVAIGETGLDFYKAADRTVQTEALWAQLTIANELNLPVIIHCRDAAVEMRDVFEKFRQRQGALSGVMHCW
ncbi:MAG: TatD family hydrolase, partial [Cyanobacteria bacterium J06659_2]